MSTVLLFMALTFCMAYNWFQTYKIWFIDRDCYHAWARYIVTFCAVGSTVCYIIGLMEVLK